MTDHHWKDFEEMGEEAVRRKLAGAFNDTKKKSAREWLAWKERQRFLESEAAKESYNEKRSLMDCRMEKRQTITLVVAIHSAISAIPVAIIAVISIYLYLNK